MCLAAQYTYPHNEESYIGDHYTCAQVLISNSHEMNQDDEVSLAFKSQAIDSCQMERGSWLRRV